MDTGMISLKVFFLLVSLLIYAIFYFISSGLMNEIEGKKAFYELEFKDINWLAFGMMLVAWLFAVSPAIEPIFLEKTITTNTTGYTPGAYLDENDNVVYGNYNVWKGIDIQRHILNVLVLLVSTYLNVSPTIAKSSYAGYTWALYPLFAILALITYGITENAVAAAINTR